MTAAFHVGLPTIQVAFSMLICCRPSSRPCRAGWSSNSARACCFRPARCSTGLSWVLASHVSTSTGLYLTYGLLGGIGTGISMSAWSA